MKFLKWKGNNLWFAGRKQKIGNFTIWNVTEGKFKCIQNGSSLWLIYLRANFGLYYGIYEKHKIRIRIYQWSQGQLYLLTLKPSSF